MIVRAPIGMIGRRGCTDGNVFRVDIVENNEFFILLTAPTLLPWCCAGFGPARKFVSALHKLISRLYSIGLAMNM